MLNTVRIGPVKTGSNPLATDTSVARFPSRAVPTTGRPASDVPPSHLLDLVAGLANAAPPIDHARVAQLRRAIADGTYQIDAEALANAIISHAIKECP